MGATVNALQAARLAGVSERTMREWIVKGKVPGARKVARPGGPAEWEIDPQALPRRHQLAEQVVQTPAGTSDTGDLCRRLQVAEEQLARLQQLVESQRVIEPLIVVAQPERPDPVAPRPYVPLGDRLKLPDGWVSFNAWCVSHGVNHRAMQQEIAKGRLPKPERGEWWERPQGPTLSAYTLDQHAVAAAFARARWPDRFTRCEACEGD